MDTKNSCLAFQQMHENGALYTDADTYALQIQGKLTNADAQYPECEKLAANNQFIRDVLEFIDYASTEKAFLMTENTYSEEYVDGSGSYEIKKWDRANAEKLLHKMLGIDPVKLESERQHMLASL